MKLFSLIRLAIAAILLTASAQAASPAGKRFAGFVAKEIITLTIQDRQSYQTEGSKTTQTLVVTGNVPKFHVGQTIKFTIGAKGQLKGPGFILNLGEGNADYNQYVSAASAKKVNQDAAILTKNSSGGTQQIVLYFYDDNVTGPSSSVTYLLK